MREFENELSKKMEGKLDWKAEKIEAMKKEASIPEGTLLQREVHIPLVLRERAVPKVVDIEQLQTNLDRAELSLKLVSEQVEIQKSKYCSKIAEAERTIKMYHELLENAEKRMSDSKAYVKDCKRKLKEAK